MNAMTGLLLRDSHDDKTREENHDMTATKLP
jgi:hypothetical protein